MPEQKSSSRSQGRLSPETLSSRRVPSSGEAPTSRKTPETRFREVQASLGRLSELDTAPASLKSQRFDGPASSAPPISMRVPSSRNLGARLTPVHDERAPDTLAVPVGFVRGVHLDAAPDAPRFNLDEAVEYAAAGELPVDVLRSSVARLGQLAWLHAAVLASVLLVGALAADHTSSLWLERYPGYLGPLLGALSLNGALLLVTKAKGLAPRAVVKLGFVYLVLDSFALAVFRHSHPWPADELLRSWAPATVVIALFGALVPARPRSVLGFGLVAAATDPLAALLLHSESSPGSLLLLALSPFFGSALGYFSSKLTHDFTEKITRAREVGSYRLVEKLGTGAMGEVWRAEHRMLARGAAIKLIKPEALHVDTQEEARRVVRLFELEVQATAMLTSPHTIDIYDFGITGEGHFYYAMELLDGFDLQALVTRHGPQAPTRVAHILAQIADSLSEAHSHHYVHRDLKPANVFLCRYGGRVDFVKVLDFGLVLDQSNDTDDAMRPGDEHIIGTPAVAAPESLIAEARVDHRSDLYSLGCIGYWLLTGTRVFPAKTKAEMLRMHATEAPERPSLRVGRPIPSLLEDLVMQCLEKSPARRPQSALDVILTLETSGLVGHWTRDAALDFWEQHATGPMSARLVSGA